MKTDIELLGRIVHVHLTPAAEAAAAQLKSPLTIELQLLFSCLVAKRVHFCDGTHPDAVRLAPDLFIRFRATMGTTCDLSRDGGDISHAYNDLVKARPFVPTWCRIDCPHGRWSGEFGYDGAAQRRHAAAGLASPPHA